MVKRRSTAVHYRNAKVVLVGDSGVGKTGLALALTRRPWVPTDSTHARSITTFDRRRLSLTVSGHEELREVLLWDLAGQPGYRLVHQLHLEEVHLALIVFDARSEREPFAGVRFWDRALRLAGRRAARSISRFLIAARSDRGGVPVSRERIERLLKELECSAFFESSAKEGWGVADLIAAVHSAIAWSDLPRVSSNLTFVEIKDFLLGLRDEGLTVCDSDGLFLRYCKESGKSESAVRREFDICTRQLQSAGVLRTLSFGGLVLLHPEILDFYAASIVHAARSEPDGLGFVEERSILAPDFRVPSDGRVQDQKMEYVVKVATIEELVAHELALRETGERGTLLVFPGEFMRELPDRAALGARSVVIRFNGVVQHVASTLLVRLSRSEFLKPVSYWAGAAAFAAPGGGACGIELREPEEGTGEITLCYDELLTAAERKQVETFVVAHLERRASQPEIHRVARCAECQTEIEEAVVRRRMARGFDWSPCPLCTLQISLVEKTGAYEDEEMQRVPDALRATAMDLHADRLRTVATTEVRALGRRAVGDFDVFLSYKSRDRKTVAAIATMLSGRGLVPWFDQWMLRPGDVWQRRIEEVIEVIPCAAVFVGRDGLGPWQDAEAETLLRQAVLKGAVVIPVMLESCDAVPRLPAFMAARVWVDFRMADPEPLEQLIWGIQQARERVIRGGNVAARLLQSQG